EKAEQTGVAGGEMGRPDNSDRLGVFYLVPPAEKAVSGGGCGERGEVEDAGVKPGGICDRPSATTRETKTNSHGAILPGIGRARWGSGRLRQPLKQIRSGRRHAFAGIGHVSLRVDRLRIVVV